MSEREGSPGNLNWTLKKLIASICPCVSTRRKIVPLNATPPNTVFVSVGKKKTRKIRVVHVRPNSNVNLNFQRNTANVKISSAIPDSKDYDSDSSADEYWFTKWTLPFQTVKKLQRESLRRRNLKSGMLQRISLRLSNRRKSKRDGSRKRETCDMNTVFKGASVLDYANSLANQIIQEAETQVTGRCKLPDANADTSGNCANGIVNLSFIGSPANPDAVIIPNDTAPSNNAVTPVATKPLLFFLHGAGESSNYWTNIMHYFSSLDYEILALDLLGHGYSTAPKNPKLYTFQKLFSDVLNVFDDHVSDGRKSILIGHGYGCSFAVRLSRQRSSSVCLMVLLSSGGPTPLAPSFDWRNELNWPLSLADCFRPFLSCGLKRRALYGPRGKNAIYKTENSRSLPSYVLCNIAKGQSWPEGDVAYHRKIHVPTLLVHGMKDTHVSLVEMCEMERTIPRAFLEVIPDAGHDIPADSPRALCKMMRKFIENWER